MSAEVVEHWELWPRVAADNDDDDTNYDDDDNDDDNDDDDDSGRALRTVTPGSSWRENWAGNRWSPWVGSHHVLKRYLIKFKSLALIQI